MTRFLVKDDWGSTSASLPCAQSRSIASRIAYGESGALFKLAPEAVEACGERLRRRRQHVLWMHRVYS